MADWAGVYAVRLREGATVVTVARRLVDAVAGVLAVRRLPAQDVVCARQLTVVWVQNSPRETT